MGKFFKKGIFVVLAIIIIIFGFLFTWEYVDAGTYKICQKLSGKLIVIDKPGWSYTGLISNSTTYNVAGIYINSLI